MAIARDKHPAWLRVVHWLNVPWLALMIWSGWLIYWANDVYTPFLPPSFYERLGLDHGLARGLAVHFTVAWLWLITFAVYAFMSLRTGHWRRLVRGAPYNPAQRTAYALVFAVGVLELATGLAMAKPTQLGALTQLLGGYARARALHFAGMAFLILFIGVHVVQVIRAGWQNFRSMVSGVEETVAEKFEESP